MLSDTFQRWWASEKGDRIISFLAYKGFTIRTEGSLAGVNQLRRREVRGEQVSVVRRCAVMQSRQPSVRD
jgi:hypothetical protein